MMKSISRVSIKPLNEIMTGADIVIKRLEKNNVTNIFGLPGGASIPLYNSLKDSKIKQVLSRQEQGGCGFAEGYSKSSNKVGVFIATSGPGITNTITNIVDAQIDSVPLIVICGQVNSKLIGLDSFQEVAISDIVNDYCKHVFKVTHISQIPRMIDEAFFIAKFGRPGVVLIDIPKDIQMDKYDYDENNLVTLNLNKFIRNTRKILGHHTIKRFLSMINNSKRPVFYIGGGIIDASMIFRQVLKHLNIPVVSTLMGLGSVSSDNSDYYLGMIGMHGSIEANYAVNSCDLLIAIGARFDDRVTGKLELFAKDAQIIHIDIDSKEIGKNKEIDLSICCDSSMFLYEILETCAERLYYVDFLAWYNEIIADTIHKRIRYDDHINLSKSFTCQKAIKVLNKVCEKLSIKPIISTGVGIHQMTVAQHFNFKKPRKFLTSGGFGTMGLGLPFAIGAWYANPDSIIIDVDGDGSLLMNIQELATIGSENIPVKIIIINNKVLGMVEFWGNRFHDYSDYTKLEYTMSNQQNYPNFCKIAEGFGIKSANISDADDLENVLLNVLLLNEPYIINVNVDQSECLPFIPANGSYTDIIIDDSNF